MTDNIKTDGLKNLLRQQRYVNVFTSTMEPGTLGWLAPLKEEYKDKLWIELDVNLFADCEEAEQEVPILRGQINRALAAFGQSEFQSPAFSISSLLLKWADQLDSEAILVFHYFHDLYSNLEKNILRSLRKTLRNQEEISSRLGLLLLSNQPVYKWELYPESNLDDRHVSLFQM